jgi:hypothetical protein
MIRLLSNPEEGKNEKNTNFNNSISISKKKSTKDITLIASRNNNKQWSGVTNHSKSFESAKLESHQCLE